MRPLPLNNCAEEGKCLRLEKARPADFKFLLNIADRRTAPVANNIIRSSQRQKIGFVLKDAVSFIERGRKRELERIYGVNTLWQDAIGPFFLRQTTAAFNEAGRFMSKNYTRVEKATLRLEFDDQNPLMAELLRLNAAELVTTGGKELKEIIRRILFEGFRDKKTVIEMARDLRAHIGLDRRSSKILRNFAFTTRRSGITVAAADKAISRRGGQLLRRRANLIARTEVMWATNTGNQAVADQSVREGFLPKDSKKRLIVTWDDRLCKICRGIADQVVPLKDKFKTLKGKIFRVPPIHPACRCTFVIIPGDVEGLVSDDAIGPPRNFGGECRSGQCPKGTHRAEVAARAKWTGDFKKAMFGNQDEIELAITFEEMKAAQDRIVPLIRKELARRSKIAGIDDALDTKIKDELAAKHLKLSDDIRRRLSKLSDELTKGIIETWEIAEDQTFKALQGTRAWGRMTPSERMKTKKAIIDFGRISGQKKEIELRLAGMNDLEAKKEAMVSQRASIVHELLGEVREVGGIYDQSILKTTKPWKTTFDKVFSKYPKDWIDQTNGRNMRMATTGRRRSQYDVGGNKIEMSKIYAKKTLTKEERKRFEETIYHEYGHAISWNNSLIADWQDAYFQHRIKGESLRHLGAGYRRNESYFPDKWTNPYMGKNYRDKESNEWFTVSMEEIMGGRDADIFAKDKETFDWALMILFTQ